MVKRKETGELLRQSDNVLFVVNGLVILKGKKKKNRQKFLCRPVICICNDR